MSLALENIWDEPIEAPSEHTRYSPAAVEHGGEGENDSDNEGVFRPSKRRKSTALFLDDPDEDGTSPRKSPAKSTRPDIDALFDDLDDPAPASSKPFDLTALRRAAQQRAERDAPASSYAQYKVASSSPVRPGADALAPFGGTGAGGKNGKDGGGAGNAKRALARLDEERLLGAEGLPALVQLCRSFKPRGKGHELADLNRLFSVYQFWAHKMYPKMQFSDVVNRVEKLCHSKRMHVALSVWRDEVHGTLNGQKVGVDVDADVHSENGDNDNEDVFGLRQTNAKTSSSPRASSPENTPLPPVSRAPSSDGFGAGLSEGEGEDDVPMETDGDAGMGAGTEDPFDLAALLFAEERRKPATFKTKTNPISNPDSAPAALPTSAVNGEDDGFPDEDELWAAVQGQEVDGGGGHGLGLGDSTGDGGRERPGASAGQEKGQAPAGNGTARTRAPANDDHGDDMWDLVDDMEREQQTASARGGGSGKAGQTQAAGSAASAPKTNAGATAASTGGGDAQSRAGAGDDDWDDMYV